MAEHKNIDVVILCGGSGTRLREQTEFIPKPMIPIGNRPMVHHIMSHYSKFGHRSFILALGYKQHLFKEYFALMPVLTQDCKLGAQVNGGETIFYGEDFIEEDEWDITMINTGERTLKGGRLARVAKYINSEIFMFTYGDGLSDINLDDLLEFHNSHDKILTITGINPEPRFGELKFSLDGHIVQFSEKPAQQTTINGGYMVADKRIFDYLNENEDCDLEVGAFEELAADGEMVVYPHKGFWKTMDTLKDMEELNKMWNEGDAPWEGNE